MNVQVFAPHRAIVIALKALLALTAVSALATLVTGFLAPGMSASKFALPLLLIPAGFGIYLILVHMGKVRIEVSPERIRFVSDRGPVHMYWGEVRHFHFSVLPFTRRSRSGIEIYEVADGMRPIRFYEITAGCDQACREHPDTLTPARLQEAGILLSRGECRALVDAIRRYAGLIPVRKEDLV